MQKYVIVKEYKHIGENNVESRRNELEALKNVKCAYLPQVYDYITKGKHSFTVMEYIEGESLDKLLAQGGKFTHSQVIKWYGQLASALESLHRQDVCHRDIKPANIMLTPCGDVCLIDFGAALVRGNNTGFTSRSLGYASPEQLEIFEWFERAFSSSARKSYVGSNSHIGSNPYIGHNSYIACDSYVDRESYDAHKSSDSGFYSLFVAETQTLGGCRETALVDYRCRLSEPRTEEAGARSQPPTIEDTDWKLSDIYSLGATMYHLLTGRRSPGKPHEHSILERYSCNYGYFALGNIIEKSMRTNPSERFASAAELSGAIRTLRAGS